MEKDLFEWQSHENHVAAIYRLLGYKVIQNINISGQQTDLLCEKFLPGAGRTILYVECKYTDDAFRNSVSKDVVNQFAANFHSLKTERGWNVGVMVSNRAFSQFAKAAAELHSDIVLKTTDELYADLFQIQTYLHSCIHDYEADQTLIDYIPLNAVDQSNIPQQVTKLEDLFSKWLNDQTNNQLCLLGDFGTGKTTFMRHIHSKCAKQFLNGQSIRMPLYLELRDYFDVKDGNELIDRFCSLELATKVSRRLFKEFTEAGRFLLLLDGFDEMGVVSDSESRRKNYLKLNQLIRPGSKVVITCRPAYFVTHEELLHVFGLYKRQMGATPPHTRGDKKRTDIYSQLSSRLKSATYNDGFNELLAAVGYIQAHSTIAALELFSPSQIKAYLASKRDEILTASDGLLDDKSLFERMSAIYDLEDLAKRPILLKLIVNTLPLFKQNESGKYTVQGSRERFDDITPSVLYYVYTEGELTREYDKGEIRWQIDRDQRRTIVGELAFSMLENDALALSSATFSAIVGRYFDSAGDKLDQLATDIRTCSFLTLDRSGYLRFAHKSFLEYYVAQHLVSLLRTERRGGDALGKRVLSEEIFYFLGDLIRSFYPMLLRILHELATTPESICRCNALNLLNYAGHPRPIIENIKVETLSYVKTHMPKLQLYGSEIGHLRFLRSEIADLAISSTKISKFILHGGLIKQSLTESQVDLFDCAGANLKTIVRKSHIKSLQLSKTSIERSAFIDSTIMVGPSYGSSLKSVSFQNVLFMTNDETHLLSSTVEDVTFTNCVFLYVDFDSDFLATASFQRCVFVRCYLTDGRTLSNLAGSRGFFQYKGVNKNRQRIIEIADQPYLWTPTKADKAAAIFLSAEQKRRRSSGSSEELSWEQALAGTFPATKLTEFANLTFSEVRKRLNDAKSLASTLAG